MPKKDLEEAIRRYLKVIRKAKEASKKEEEKTEKTKRAS